MDGCRSTKLRYGFRQVLLDLPVSDLLNTIMLLQLLKQPSEPYTAKSDVYGLGGCLYELLTSHDFADRARRPIR